MLTMVGVGAQRKTQYKSFNGFKTTNSEFEGMDLFSFKRLGGENCLKGKVLKFFLSKVLTIFSRASVPPCDDNEINRINHSTPNKQ